MEGVERLTIKDGEGALAAPQNCSWVPGMEEEGWERIQGLEKEIVNTVVERRAILKSAAWRLLLSKDTDFVSQGAPEEHQGIFLTIIGIWRRFALVRCGRKPPLEPDVPPPLTKTQAQWNPC